MNLLIETAVLKRATDVSNMCSNSKGVQLQRQDNSISFDALVGYSSLRTSIVSSKTIYRHLEDVENRLQQLETLIARHLPGINVEEALRSPTPLQMKRVSSFTTDPPEAPTSSRDPEAREDQPENEALPPEASGFDWRETAIDLNELADGMASLSLDPSGKGYLGICCHFHLSLLFMLISCLYQDQLLALWF
jgi:hypothetical protein